MTTITCECCGIHDSEEHPVFVSIYDMIVCDKCDEYISNEHAQKELEKIARKEGITVEELCRDIDRKFETMQLDLPKIN